MDSRGEHDAFLSWMQKAPSMGTHMDMYCSKKPFSSSGKANIWCSLIPKTIQLCRIVHSTLHFSTDTNSPWTGSSSPSGESRLEAEEQYCKSPSSFCHLNRVWGRVSTMPNALWAPSQFLSCTKTSCSFAVHLAALKPAVQLHPPHVLGIFPHNHLFSIRFGTDSETQHPGCTALFQTTSLLMVS